MAAYMESESLPPEPTTAPLVRGGNGHRMSAPRSPLRAGRVAERIVDEIVAYIDTNGLAPGAKLPPERVFIEQFGVSRSSLREALRILSTIGIIDVRHGNGMYVAATPGSTATPTAIFDATEQNALRNLVETRFGVELAAVTAATQRASDEDLLGLQHFLDEQERQLAVDPNFTWEPLGFELLVVELSSNGWLYEIELMLRDAWLSLSTGLRTSVGRHAEWLAEHRAIVASMRSRNVTQAQRLVMAHLSLERFEDDLASIKANPRTKLRRATKGSS